MPSFVNVDLTKEGTSTEYCKGLAAFDEEAVRFLNVL